MPHKHVGVFALFQAVATLHDALATFPSLTDMAHNGYCIDREAVGATTCQAADGQLETLVGVGDQVAIFSCTSQAIRRTRRWTMTVMTEATEADLRHAAQVIAADAQRLHLVGGTLPDRLPPTTPM
jgi:hypothetical protein